MVWRFKYNDEVYEIEYRRESRIGTDGKPYIEHTIQYEGITLTGRSLPKAIKGLKKIIDEFNEFAK